MTRGQTDAKLDSALVAGLSSETSKPSRSNQPRHRKERPMKETCISRTPETGEARQNICLASDFAQRATLHTESEAAPSGLVPRQQQPAGFVPRTRPAQRASLDSFATCAGSSTLSDSPKRSSSAATPPARTPQSRGHRGAVVFHDRRVRRDGEGTVAINETRSHLKYLRSSGRTLEHLSDLTGLSVAVLRVVLQHKGTGVDREVSSRIMAVPFGPAPGETQVPSIGAQRRLQALAAMGHPLETFANRLRNGSSIAAKLLTKSPDALLVPIELWLAIDQIYDELAMVPGPDPALRDRARADGWVTALAWDEDEIDNPRAHPHPTAPSITLGIDEIAIERRLNHDHSVILSPDETQVIIRLASEGRLCLEDLAAVLGSSVATAERRLRRFRSRERAAAADRRGKTQDSDTIDHAPASSADRAPEPVPARPVSAVSQEHDGQSEDPKLTLFALPSSGAGNEAPEPDLAENSRSRPTSEIYSPPSILVVSDTSNPRKEPGRHRSSCPVPTRHARVRRSQRQHPLPRSCNDTTATLTLDLLFAPGTHRQAEHIERVGPSARTHAGAGQCSPP